MGESVHKPIEYYQNNLGGTLELARALRDHGVYDIVFSSSATVYGQPDHVPVREDSELKPATNPYGRTKTMNEQMLRAKAVVRTGDMGSCCTMVLYSASGMEKYVKQFDCRFEEG